MKKVLWKNILIAAFILCFISLWGTGAMAYDGYNNPIRVHLAGTSGSVSVSVSYGSYDVAGTSVAAGQSVSLGSGQTLSSRDGEGRFVYNNKEYRGDLINSGGYIVNKLGMEEYLYSVVSQEIGGYSPGIEALKAQAVAARSFACYRKQNPRTAYYDLYAGTSDQAYGGYSGENYSTDTASVSYRIREACNATKGQVLYYDGSVVQGIYCANTGGHSADAADVWGSSIPSLKGVAVPYDSQSFVADNYSSGGTYQAVKMPTGYQWRKTFACADLVTRINSTSGQNLGALEDIVIERGSGGYAKNVTFKGSNATVTLSGERVRTALGLRSASFSVVFGESLSAVQPFSLSYLDASGFDSFLNRSGRVVNFQGRGYGHSVGMSQWAACVMAYQGMNYKDILTYFYTGVAIESFKG
ncbi:MAG: SpoIID/LytB domain-containing protein [Bacillota bacterium]|nr:SpoIID/LytB domain-containing protein [Bacillota bacterium]